MKSLTKKIIAASLLVVPLVSLAAAPTPAGVPQVQLTDPNQIFRILQSVVNWVAAVFFTVAVLFIFYAAWLYLGAAGDPEKLGKAKDQLIYSIVAIAIGLIAFSVTQIVENFIK